MFHMRVCSNLLHRCVQLHISELHYVRTSPAGPVAIGQCVMLLAETFETPFPWQSENGNPKQFKKKKRIHRLVIYGDMH